MFHKLNNKVLQYLVQLKQYNNKLQIINIEY